MPSKKELMDLVKAHGVAPVHPLGDSVSPGRDEAPDMSDTDIQEAVAAAQDQANAGGVMVVTDPPAPMQIVGANGQTAVIPQLGPGMPEPDHFITKAGLDKQYSEMLERPGRIDTQSDMHHGTMKTAQEAGMPTLQSVKDWLASKDINVLSNLYHKVRMGSQLPTPNQYDPLFREELLTEATCLLGDDDFIESVYHWAGTCQRTWGSTSLGVLVVHEAFNRAFTLCLEAYRAGISDTCKASKE